MNSLKQIKADPKSGKECLTDNGQKLNYTLLNFWQWSVSDILSNATRGRFAEFVVGSSVGLDPLELRNEWDAYDLTTAEGIKIEVKSAAYLQSWNQKNYSGISFSIKPARYWDAVTNIQQHELKRHADIYVFCLLKHTDKLTVNPLKLEQWEFYVLPTFRLDHYKRSQHSITINSLKKLAEAKAYGELKREILRSFEDQKNMRTT